VLAGCTGLRIEKIRFIGSETNNKEPGPAEVGSISQVPNGIDFCVTHFWTPHVSQTILTRGEHFAALTDEGHMMVCVMPRHVPALLRIDECVKMTVQPSREHRTC